MESLYIVVAVVVILITLYILSGDSSSSAAAESAKVALALVDTPVLPVKQWKQSGVTAAVGGGGGSPYALVCGENAYVTEFDGRSGSLIDNIGITCSDGTKLGPKGGAGGGAFNVANPGGFEKLTVRAGSLIDNIKFFGGGKELASYGGGGGSPHDLACVDGKIMGLNVRSGRLVDNVQVVCATQ